MNKFDFILTEDNSVGLFNNEVKDIYHSKYGALTEANQKFIEPSFCFFEKDELNILDICYGIGYNTKAAINTNKNLKIDALEFDEDLILLSPFIKDGIKDNYACISILNNILKFKEPDFIYNFIIEQISKSSIEFFDENMVGFIKFLKEKGYINNPMDGNNSFLHNIYYNYISVNNKYDLKSNNNNDIAINYYIDDARISLKSLNNTYDIVFLDAFSPQKDPTLWTIDFLSLIKQHMNTNSVLVSYSKSTPFRNALHKLNFNVGKTFIDGIDMGTIASLDKNIIINPLNDYDLELLNTRSGITYKDFNLSLSGDEILKNREIEQNNSNLISHTQFLKKYKK
ncbi:MAG: hypothetical protein E7Z90_05190 [Cyanobacteria bacterium SIG29]|nr:hypothetical protein [Cyanobacteria bacterium SIG29]